MLKDEGIISEEDYPEAPSRKMAARRSSPKKGHRKGKMRKKDQAYG